MYLFKIDAWMCTTERIFIQLHNHPEINSMWFLCFWSLLRLTSHPQWWGSAIVPCYGVLIICYDTLLNATPTSNVTWHVRVLHVTWHVRLSHVKWHVRVSHATWHVRVSPFEEFLILQFFKSIKWPNELLLFRCGLVYDVQRTVRLDLLVQKLRCKDYVAKSKSNN